MKISVFALLSATLACGAALANDAPYPSRSITMIVPFAPGGGTDIVARLLAAKLQARLGQPVVIENKPGAATAIGAGAAAKAAPDGYTLLLSGSSTFSIVPGLRGGLPYHPIDSFAHIGIVAQTPLVMFVGTQVQAKSVAELVAQINKQPDGAMYATFGNGSGPHFAGAMLAEAAKLKLTPVPYKGGAPAMTAVIAGEVWLGFDTLAVVAAQAKAGKVRALAVTSDARSTLLADVPTYAEAGIAAASLRSWYGLVAPAKTPEVVVKRLETELAAVMADREVQQSLLASGLEPQMLRAQAFQNQIRTEMDRFKKVAQQANITLD